MIGVWFLTADRPVVADADGEVPVMRAVPMMAPESHKSFPSLQIGRGLDRAGSPSRCSRDVRHDGARTAAS